MSHQVEVSRVVAASPQRVYELVSDLPRMGEWSPENTGGEWVKGSAGPAVGAGREFAFDVMASGLSVAGWGFSLEAEDGGTRVTQWWDDHRNPVVAKITGLALRVPNRATHNRAGMEKTLDALSRAV